MKSLAKAVILYIGPVPPEIGGKSAGGIATHAWELAREAYKRDYEVHVLANTTSSFTRDGIRVVCPPQRNKLLKAFCGVKLWLTVNKNRIGSLNFFNFKEKIGVIYEAYLLPKIMNSVKPDLIHIHSLHNTRTSSLKLLQNSTPLLITDHGFWQHIHGKKDLEKIRKMVSEADYIICPSNFSKQQIENYQVAPLVQKKVIHHPQDVNKIPLLDGRKIKEELGVGHKKIILFSGVSEPVKRKGLGILLETMVINPYLREECVIIVITNEKGIDYACNFTKKQQIKVLILGPQSWDKIVEFYNVADVFVMPSKSESLGIVYEEALLAGTPVIGFHKILSELEKLLGIYIGEKFDASREGKKNLAKKIIKVLNAGFDRELLRRKVIEKLSWDTKFSEFDSVYKELLAKKYQK